MDNTPLTPEAMSRTDLIIELYKQIDKTRTLESDLYALQNHNCPYCEGRGFVVGWENSMPNCSECNGTGAIEYVPKKDYEALMGLLKDEIFNQSYDSEDAESHWQYYCQKHNLKIDTDGK